MGDSTRTIENVPSQGTYASRPFLSHDSLTTTRFQQKQPATGGYRGKTSAALIGVCEILHQCVAIPMIRNEAPFCVRGIRQLKTIRCFAWARSQQSWDLSLNTTIVTVRRRKHSEHDREQASAKIIDAFPVDLDEKTSRIENSVSEQPIRRGAARQASPFGAGLKPLSIRSSLDWANEFTSVEFLVFHVSITERTLSALLS